MLDFMVKEADAYANIGRELYNRAIKAMTDQSETELWFIGPAIVNISFSIELKLKYIIAVSKGTFVKVHNLKKLLDEIPCDAKEQKRTVQLISYKHTGYSSLDFEKNLEECSYYFTNARYSYERESQIYAVRFLYNFCTFQRVEELRT